MRTATLERTTKETTVRVALDLDGIRTTTVRTGVAMFDHLLEAFALHARITLELEARSLDGILHHVVEDSAIVLGRACASALGERSKICRYGHAVIPMDDALVRCVVDVGGRSFSRIAINFRRERIEDLPSDLISHVIASFATHAGVTVHLSALDGWDDHHIAEAAFKALARACSAAWRADSDVHVLSTKGAW